MVKGSVLNLTVTCKRDGDHIWLGDHCVEKPTLVLELSKK